MSKTGIFSHRMQVINEVQLRIRALHLKFAKERGSGKTYCPSEVASEFAPSNWRKKIEIVRQVADSLVESGELVTVQGGIIINYLSTRATGPIRLKTSRASDEQH